MFIVKGHFLQVYSQRRRHGNADGKKVKGVLKSRHLFTLLFKPCGPKLPPVRQNVQQEV
jgi:transposase